jgi:SNF2 family DNA or RNA helicase
MGLGKTIQTISLLSSLACDYGIWGPHLIIVPTTIIMNWELEIKRWCPALFWKPKRTQIQATWLVKRK